MGSEKQFTLEQVQAQINLEREYWKQKMRGLKEKLRSLQFSMNTFRGMSKKYSKCVIPFCIEEIDKLTGDPPLIKEIINKKKPELKNLISSKKKKSTYNRDWKLMGKSKKKIICKECGEKRLEDSRGMCSPCYNKFLRKRKKWRSIARAVEKWKANSCKQRRPTTGRVNHFSPKSPTLSQAWGERWEPNTVLK